MTDAETPDTPLITTENADTSTVADQIAQMQDDLDATLDGIRSIIAAGHGVGAVTVALSPAEVACRMSADGTLEPTNRIAISRAHGTDTVTYEIALDAFDGDNTNALITTALIAIGAMHSLTDRQIINALLARLDGEVTLTMEEIAQAARPLTLQFDGLKIALVEP